MRPQASPLIGRGGTAGACLRQQEKNDESAVDCRSHSRIAKARHLIARTHALVFRALRAESNVSRDDPAPILRDGGGVVFQISSQFQDLEYGAGLPW